MTAIRPPLFELLPRVFRIADLEAGGPLRALFDALEVPYRMLERELEQMYEDLFIETCDEAVLPTFAQLIDAPADATRAEIAGELRRRRRPGTLDTIVATARQVTGLVVQGVETLPGDGLRHDGAAVTSLGGSARVDLYVYVTDPVPVADGEARPLGDGRFTVHPLGVDAPLLRDPGRATAPRFVPDALGFGDDERDVLANFTIRIDGEAVPGERLRLVDLRDWPEVVDDRVWVDPQRGRIRVGPGAQPRAVTVEHATGARADLGGGAYPRPDGSRPPTVVVTNRDQELRGLIDAEDCVVELDHDHIQRGDIEIVLAAGSQRIVRAAPGRRPCLAGSLVVTGPAEGRATFEIEGLMVDGAIVVSGNVDLCVRDVTCFAAYGHDDPPASVVGGAGSSISVDRSIVGPVRVDPDCGPVTIERSIIDASGGESALIAAGATAIRWATVIGGLEGGPFTVEHSVVTGEPAIVDHLAPANRLESLRYGDPRYASPQLMGLHDLLPDAHGHVLVGAHAAVGHLRRLRRLRSRLADVVPLDVTVDVFLL